MPKILTDGCKKHWQFLPYKLANDASLSPSLLRHLSKSDLPKRHDEQLPLFTIDA